MALVLTGIVIGFHVVRAMFAGGLWRDEAGAVQLATLPSFGDTARYFQHEAFPLLFPATVRGVNWLFGGSDAGFRVLGMVVGISIIGVLWFNFWVIRSGVPLLSLVLLGFSGPFIQWGDSVRGYGLGTFLALLTVGLIWRLLEQATLARWAAATLAAVASVQCLFHTPVILLATCLGGAAVGLRRRDPKRALVVLSVGAVAALSLLPYLGPLQRGRDWDLLVRSAISLRGLVLRLHETLTASSWLGGWLWLLILLASLAICLAGQRSRPTPSPGSQGRDLLLFLGVALGCGVVGHFAFLKLLSYATHDWYYLALMGFVALLTDLVFDTEANVSWPRGLRLSLALVLAISLGPLTWYHVHLRQTNVDLVARALASSVAREDLVVVHPWYYGISFSRYYRGSAEWMTVPPIENHQFHRYDLVKRELTLPNANDSIQPLLQRVSDALENGHRVWVVGTLEAGSVDESVDALPVARGGAWRAKLIAWSAVWRQSVESRLRASAVHVEDTSIGFDGPVSRLEDLPLRRFDGVRQP